MHRRLHDFAIGVLVGAALVAAMFACGMAAARAIA